MQPEKLNELKGEIIQFSAHIERMIDKGVKGLVSRNEELLLELRESDYRISKATIYRTIKHLLDAGLLKQAHFGGGKQAHYDFVAPESSHDYLIDLDTGKIIPFANEAVVKLRQEIARKMGFDAVGHRFQIMARRADNAK